MKQTEMDLLFMKQMRQNFDDLSNFAS